jgi:integrase/recombinase XerD
LRDQALFLFLLDTGARATETTNINLDDINLRTGEILIRSGKGGKPRKVFIGKITRKAIRAYLKVAARKFDDQNKSLWISKSGNGLGYSGLNLMIRRRSKRAGIEKPSAHDFRRANALNFLRNGGDIYSLQKLMGHADLQVLRRYLAQTTDDLREAHHRYSPVDNAL